MIPGWKLRREAGRVMQQLSSLPATVAGLPGRLYEPVARRRYDRDWRRIASLSEGEVPAGPRVAVFLIYQPRGLAPSILFTCRHLLARGYAILIVANTPLSNEDRARLAPLVWKILERPNFGYDFGGYRDGILTLRDHVPAPERVIVMNDSVWFPMADAQDTLARLEDRGSDVTGLLLSIKYADRGGERPEPDRRHVESYFYMISGAAFAHPAFKAFWSGYRLSNSKKQTIKQGEIGFSRAMEAAGLSLDGLSSRPVFSERIREQDDRFLFLTLKHAAYMDRDLAAAGRALVEGFGAVPDWRARALDHIEGTVARRGFNIAFCYANDRIFGTLSVKKHLEPFFRDMRRSYLAVVAAGLVPAPDEPIYGEIRARDERLSGASARQPTGELPS